MGNHSGLIPLAQVCSKTNIQGVFLPFISDTSHKGTTWIWLLEIKHFYLLHSQILSLTFLFRLDPWCTPGTGLDRARTLGLVCAEIRLLPSGSGRATFTPNFLHQVHPKTASVLKMASESTFCRHVRNNMKDWAWLPQWVRHLNISSFLVSGEPRGQVSEAGCDSKNGNSNSTAFKGPRERQPPSLPSDGYHVLNVAYLPNPLLIKLYHSLHKFPGHFACNSFYFLSAVVVYMFISVWTVIPKGSVASFFFASP